VFQFPDSYTDFALLICLLQAIGFNLHRIDKLPRDSPVAPTGQEQPADYIINITSAQSGLQAVLKPPINTESSSMSNSGKDIRQGNVQDTSAIYSSLLPIVRPGTAHIARDVICQLMKMLCGGEQIGGSNEALAFLNQSLIKNFSPASQPELIRQKTWNIGSIHDLDDAHVVGAGPTSMLSPLQSQNVTQDLEEMSLHIRDFWVTKRLEKACKKIEEAMMVLNSNKDKNMPEGGAETAKLNKQPLDSVPKICPTTSKPTRNGHCRLSG